MRASRAYLRSTKIDGKNYKVYSSEAGEIFVAADDSIASNDIALGTILSQATSDFVTAHDMPNQNFKGSVSGGYYYFRKYQGRIYLTST